MAHTNGAPQSVQASGPVDVGEADGEAEPAGPVEALGARLGRELAVGWGVRAGAVGIAVGATVGAVVAELELQAPKSSAAVASRTKRGCGRAGRGRPTRRTCRGVKKRISVRVWSNKDSYRT